MLENNHKYYMFHKPQGFITARSDERHKTIMEFFEGYEELGLHLVGRLDKDTEGLIFVTNDGRWNQKIMNPIHHIEKKYFFWALGKLDQVDVDQISKGILLKGEEKPCASARIKIIEETTLSEIRHLLETDANKKSRNNLPTKEVFSGEIIITEGRKHQVKRMLAAVGCRCVYLKRLSIGEVILDKNLLPGEYRELTQEEVDKFQ